MGFKNAFQRRRTGGIVMALTLLSVAAPGESTLSGHADRHREQEAYGERVAEESWVESLEGLVLKSEPGSMSIRMWNLAVGRSGPIPLNDPQPTLDMLVREPRFLKLRALAIEGPASVRQGIHARTRDWLEDWTAQLDAGRMDLFDGKATPEVVSLLHVQSSRDALEAGRRVLRFLEADTAAFARRIHQFPERPLPGVSRYAYSTTCSGMSIAALKLALDRIAAQPDSYLRFSLPAHCLMQDYARCIGSVNDRIIGLAPQYTHWFRRADPADIGTLRAELEATDFWEKASILRHTPGAPPCPGFREPSHYIETTFRTLATICKNEGQ